MRLANLDDVADELHRLATVYHEERSFSKSVAFTKAEHTVRNFPSIAIGPHVSDVCENFGAVINCAVRYCLGRQTYMPSIVIGYVTPMLPNLDNTTLYTMKRDIDEAEKIPYGLGSDTIDKPTWLKFRKDIESEIERRNMNGDT